MGWMFDLTDISGRRIHLSQERWSHIQKHSTHSGLELIQQTLKNPLVIKEGRGNLRYYCRYEKRRGASARFLKVIVKYLNGSGFIITAYWVRHI